MLTGAARCILMEKARYLTKSETVNDCKDAMDYLSQNRWWAIARPVDTAMEMTDLIQPLLSFESWDWHGAVMAHMLMKWARLLSIMGMSNTEMIWWQDQRQGSDCLYFMPLATTLEGSPRGHTWNVNVHYIHGDAEMINCDMI